MRILAKASIGIAFGVLLLWLAVSEIDVEQGLLVIGRANVGGLVLAVAAYWLGIGVRIVRWRLLLRSSNMLSLRQVGQALVVGYAVNNVLPARLGEIFRADFLGRRFGVARSAALGSIIVERLMDGLSVVLLFGIGLTASGSFANNKALVGAAIAAFAFVAIGVASVYAMIFWHDRLPLAKLPWVERRVGMLVQGMMAVRGSSVFSAMALSAVVWSFEIAAVYLIMWSFGIDVTFFGACLTVGSAALSTLLPSAPGYLGSLQVAFVLAYSALGLAPVLGVLSATAVQLLLLGSVTLVGLMILLLSYFYGAAASVRQSGAGNERRPLDASKN